jgi:hypothetical protein
MTTSKKTLKLFPIIFFVSLLMFAIVAYRNPGIDFRAYYGAALLVRRGGNPYDYAQLVPVLEEISGFLGNSPYFNPPWYCLVFIPLTYLPFRWAQVLWILINLGLFYISLEWLWRVLDWKIEAWFRWVLFTFAGIFFGYSSLISENSGFVIFFGLALTLRSIQREQPKLAGLGMIIMLSKPQALFITILVLGIWALREKPAIILWAGSWLVGLLLLTTLAFPNWWDFDRSNFGRGISYYQDGTTAIVGKRVAATAYDWLTYSFGISGWLFYFVIALVGLLGLYIMIYTWRYFYTPVYMASAGTLVTLLLTPYALLYDYVTLIVPFFVVVKSLPNLSKTSTSICVGLFALIGLAQFFAELQFQAYWILVFMTGAYLIVIRHNARRPA